LVGVAAPAADSSQGDGGVKVAPVGDPAGERFGLSSAGHLDPPFGRRQLNAARRRQ
jgi:hypothetical protein